MVRFKLFKALKVLVMVLLCSVLFGYITMGLWNALMPAIFGLRAITFWQAIGLLVLSKILFGGFHRHGGGGPRRWKRHMEERWARMTPEERARFSSGLRGSGPYGFGRPNSDRNVEPASTQTAV